jgi:hypothetical protein
VMASSVAPRTVLPSTAITSRPSACTALAHSQAPRTRSSTSALTRANARRKVDSSAGPRAAPSTASAAGPASAAHCPIAANDLDPAVTPRSRRPAARPANGGARGSSAGPGPGQADQEGSGSGQPGWAKMASAGGSLKADDVSVGISIVPAGPPAVRRHAGHLTRCYETVAHSLISRLCRVPGARKKPRLASAQGCELRRADVEFLCALSA